MRIAKREPLMRTLGRRWPIAEGGMAAVVGVGTNSRPQGRTVGLECSSQHRDLVGRDLPPGRPYSRNVFRPSGRCRYQDSPGRPSQGGGGNPKGAGGGHRLSNNLAENSMRPVALGRKNWINIGSPQAGPKIAAILS